MLIYNLKYNQQTSSEPRYELSYKSVPDGIELKYTPSTQHASLNFSSQASLVATIKALDTDTLKKLASTPQFSKGTVTEKTLNHTWTIHEAADTRIIYAETSKFGILYTGNFEFPVNHIYPHTADYPYYEEKAHENTLSKHGLSVNTMKMS